uniref:Elongator complex protein 6 n=1 Tax=Lygus hesperus TaxID=30085 RepID=A0A0A9YJP0_LYGHE
MKLGYNLMSQSKRAVVLELGKALAEGTDEAPFANIGTGEEDALKGLFIGLRQRLEELKSQCRHIYFIIDNLSSFLFLGFTSRQLTTLLHYLRTLASDSVTLVISVQTNDDDEEETQLSAYLCQVADVRLAVAPLRTGSSQDVSGSIELSKKDASKIESWTKPMLYHYKLSERNVKIFLPGNIL